MKTLQHFNKFVKEITADSSRNYKQTILEKYKDDETIKKYLVLAFSPYIVFGINKAKLHKEVKVAEHILCLSTVFDLFEYLEEHNTGRDYDIAVCQLALDWLCFDEPELCELLEKLICKDLSIGCDSKTISKIIPGLIPTFSVQLAQKYFDNPEKVTGHEFAITTKLDGFRLIALKDENGAISFYSRAGQYIEGLNEIAAEIASGLPNGLALDGELTVSNYFELESKEAFKIASKIIKLKGDTPKTGLTYRVFDGMAIDEWRKQECTHTYGERRNLLEGLFGYSPEPMPHVELLPVLYRGTDETMIIDLLEHVVSKGGEGVCLNLLDAKYQWNRNWGLQKVKRMQTLDLRAVGFEEGSGRLAGTLGAILVGYKGNIVRVGSGFSDEERKLYWQQPDLVVGHVVEVKYFEELFTDGDYSLRFPTWCSNIRIDKFQPDF